MDACCGFLCIKLRPHAQTFFLHKLDETSSNRDQHGFHLCPRRLFPFVHSRNQKKERVDNCECSSSQRYCQRHLPGNFRNQILDEQEIEKRKITIGEKKMSDFLVPREKVSDIASKRPLADLFLETSIIFADIVGEFFCDVFLSLCSLTFCPHNTGFTAWSSARAPCQVFQLLESIFARFDEIASRRGVLKVETVV